MKNINLIIVILTLAVSCSNEVKETVTVKYVGTLMEIMHLGNLEAKASLDSMSLSGIYAVGALDSLSGEILIENGMIYVSKKQGETISVENESSEPAVLLVYSHVDEWTEFSVSGSDLEYLIAEKAKEAELATPFPFMLKGNFENIDFHVISFDPSITAISNHKEGAYKSSLANEDVVIVGFYSDKHQGIFTHRDSNVHMHVRNVAGDKMGHVDGLVIGGNSFTLLLPVLWHLY